MQRIKVLSFCCQVICGYLLTQCSAGSSRAVSMTAGHQRPASLVCYQQQQHANRTCQVHKGKQIERPHLRVPQSPLSEKKGAR